jgi:hypothetical protein
MKEERKALSITLKIECYGNEGTKSRPWKKQICSSTTHSNGKRAGFGNLRFSVCKIIFILL